MGTSWRAKFKKIHFLTLPKHNELDSYDPVSDYAKLCKYIRR